MIKMNLIIPIFCILVISKVGAQNDSTTVSDRANIDKIENNIFTDFRPGFVILMNGDTVPGKIDYGIDIRMSRICRFIPNDRAIEMVYKPNEIKAFRFNNGKFFIAKDLKNENNKTKRLFLEYLINGKVNVYYYKDINGSHYMIDKEGRDLIELPYEEKIKIDKNGGRYVDKSTKYKGILLLYMSDTPALTREITETPEPSHESLISLAKDYHKASCGDYSCIVYEKKASRIQYTVELAAGIQTIHNSDYVGFISNNFFISGIFVKLSQPRISESVYLKTGVLYSRVENVGYWIGLNYYKSYFSDCYKIPLQAEYMIQKGTFRPRIGYGINVYFPLFTSVSFTPGLDIKLTKNIGFSLNTDIEFVPNFLIVPVVFMGVSTTAGIHYTF